jgi:hypothetical protein
MFSKIAEIFSSFFKFRPTMDEQASIVLNKASATQTAMFLLALRGWGAQFCNSSDDPALFLSQITVTCVMHNKMPSSPEHEFLVIETLDREGNRSSLILERTVDLQPNNADRHSITDISPGEGVLGLLSNIKRILTRGSQQTDLEEGLIRQSESLSIVDKASLLSAQSFNALSESLRAKVDSLHDSPAIDHFLGEKYVFSLNWHGQNIRHFKPKETLSLFELAILADVVHKTYPKYTLLKEQCYFYAGIVYSALEREYGISSCSSARLNEDRSLVFIDNSSLSNKFGRWKGVMVSSCDDEDVSNVVQKFRDERSSEIAKVSFMIFSITSITNYYIIHRSQKQSCLK